MPNKVLIVDDEPRMCNSLKVLLCDEGYDAQAAYSGKQAIECLSTDCFDLVLLDIVMPDMNGHELMDYINSQNPETLVIVMTGHASIDSAVESLRRGAYDYLRKPFDFEQLEKRVKNALNLNGLKKENGLINAKLELTEKRYQYLVNASPDIIYILDREGKFTFINGAVESLLGYKSDQLIGRHYTSIVFEEDLGKAKCFFNQRRTGERAARGVELSLKCFQKSNGPRKLLTVELRAMGIYDRPVDQEEKTFIGTYGVARDVTDRKRLEAQLLQAQKMEAIGTLAGGIAHDFNNLLMGIQGHISLMALDIGPHHPHFDHLRGVENMVSRGACLTKQLLGFARGGKYDVRSTDLNELIDNSLEMFGRTKKEIRIHRKFQKDIWAVEVDRGQIEQVMLNLYVNAWQAMPGGGDLYLETENVRLDERVLSPFGVKPGSYVKVSVTDTGVGLDEETQQRIFEPFFTTKEVGRGTGLGLASAYGIIKNHDGIIDVCSEKGGGTTFCIYLPAAEAPVSEQVAEKREEEIHRGRETVLLVDDEDMIIDVGHKMLKVMGYEVLLARSGKEAIEVYEKNKHRVALVILDMIIPDTGGGEIYERMREINPDVKVLLSSGYSIDGEATQILEQGCDGFIQKPFGMIELAEKIREILEKK